MTPWCASKCDLGAKKKKKKGRKRNEIWHLQFKRCPLYLGSVQVPCPHMEKKLRDVVVLSFIRPVIHEIDRNSAPWYKPEVVEQKNIRRRIERKWRLNRLLCDREQYVHQCYVVYNLMESLKSSYYSDIINEHSSDQKILFKTVGKLLQKSTNKRYPPSSDDTALAKSFADFFTSKIDKIHHGLVERKIRVGSSPPDVTVCGAEFCNLAEVTQQEINKFSCKSLSKSSELDPLPPLVLKGCLTVLFPTITRVINISLSTCVMPNALKVAILSPMLKKIWCWLWTVPKLSSYLELKSSVEACWKGSCHTTYRSRHVAPLRWDVSVCI